MTEATLMERRTFGELTVLDKYGLGPIETGSGALSVDAQAVGNLNKAQFADLPRLAQRMVDEAKTLAAVRAEHVKAINDAAAAVAARESKPASMVTQAEIDPQLESVLSPTHPVVHRARVCNVIAQEHADLAAKIETAKAAMIADGLIKATKSAAAKPAA